MADIVKMKLSVKKSHIPQRRDNDARLSRELDNVFLDEHGSLNKLPKYVSDNPDTTPNTRLYEGDIVGINEHVETNTRPTGWV